MSVSLFTDELYTRIPLGLPVDQIIEMEVPAILELSSGGFHGRNSFPRRILRHMHH
jgi:hypothetical protein